MNEYIQKIKTYVSEHKKEFTTGIGVAGAIFVAIFGLALYSYNNPGQPEIVYEPADACVLFTLDEAREFLGDATINAVAPDIEQSGDLTVSKCAYSDGKIDTENSTVIAIIVRSGINDNGIALNKAQFESGMPTEDVEIVSNVGDQAYFNTKLGQLNILKQSTWVVISYGLGSDPAANTLEDAVKLADKVIN